MLVLRRLCGQSITIGDNAEIIVKVLRNENGVVSIGVDAPMTVLVDRFENY
jgi:carbon storage regulator CsrA